MEIEMVQISSAYRLIPPVEQIPAETFSSLEALNKKVNEVASVINKETEEIISRNTILDKSTSELEQIYKKESTWTNKIVD